MQIHQSQISGLQTTFLWLFNLNMPNKKEVASHSLVQKWLSWRHKRLLTISVLAVISKILERHIATSLSTYLHSYDLLYNLQSAFQPDHTTETALIKLTDELLFDMDNNMVTGLAFVSFRKAFNVINHWLLPKKLSIYEASNLSLKWFGSYLTRRKHNTHITDQPISVIFTKVALDVREVRKLVKRLLWEQQRNGTILVWTSNGVPVSKKFKRSLII